MDFSNFEEMDFGFTLKRGKAENYKIERAELLLTFFAWCRRAGPFAAGPARHEVALDSNGESRIVFMLSIVGIVSFNSSHAI